MTAMAGPDRASSPRNGAPAKPPFAAWLSDELKQRNWRQRQLAEASGVSQQTASRWLAGRSTPAGIHLRSLAVAFDVTTDEILALCERSDPADDERIGHSGRIAGLGTLPLESDPRADRGP